MNSASQFAVWWQNEKERDFTRLECGLLGAMFCAVTIGVLVVVRSVIGRPNAIRLPSASGGQRIFVRRA